jgi:hypothetical protein
MKHLGIRKSRWPLIVKYIGSTTGKVSVYIIVWVWNWKVRHDGWWSFHISSLFITSREPTFSPFYILAILSAWGQKN